eukprot:CAMPEP_0117053532 /NCGR_PEP_ID=MMETSP0472-20121206/37029_1 /TAXON_ID=693140 ORGANISM="Tiarina fusus, Strain LIS" /NCGR_SAMPLE_ID=MMETSP0472 /ASSEMBLY_ACC=CAM_ASM_000603 /LENGTH=364 /DNA_ID=CAMNT_0004768629 /DNA_START=113 /DNA_END=1207 /DNA_ORIENTATION=+
MCEIIQAKGYPCEEHFATTPDGYILGMFRMPQPSKPGPPVLLQHGLLDSSFTWVLNYPGQSFPYILYDLGYDVWLGNNRGNTYSKNHTTLSIHSKEFWEFSWDQMAEYDFPTQIAYALQTNAMYPKLVYIGHSEGTTQAFAGLSANSSISNSLYGFVGLGPVVSVTHMSNLWLKDLLDLGVEWIWNLLGLYQFLPTPVELHSEFVWACAECPICCNEVIELICGRHHGAFNNSRMNVMSGHEPGGTSTQNIHHWAQMVKDPTFQKMDFGSKRNQEIYGQAQPPVYDLNNLPKDLPMMLYSGSHDELADPDDVQTLVTTLEGIVESLYWKEVRKYAHLDFAWALDAADEIYVEVTDIMRDWVEGI